MTLCLSFFSMTLQSWVSIGSPMVSSHLNVKCQPRDIINVGISSGVINKSSNTNSMFLSTRWHSCIIHNIIWDRRLLLKESTKTNLCAHRPFLHRVALKSDVFHDPGGCLSEHSQSCPLANIGLSFAQTINLRSQNATCKRFAHENIQAPILHNWIFCSIF